VGAGAGGGAGCVALGDGRAVRFAAVAVCLAVGVWLPAGVAVCAGGVLCRAAACFGGGLLAGELVSISAVPVDPATTIKAATLRIQRIRPARRRTGCVSPVSPVTHGI
jgi:hypothetical protein